MNSIVKILVERDGYSNADAETLVRESKYRIIQGEEPRDVLYELGLPMEGDYYCTLMFKPVNKTQIN